MDIKEIILTTVNAPKGVLRKGIEDYERILEKKSNVGKPELTSLEKNLLEFEPTIKIVPTKENRKPTIRDSSWMKFLKDDEMKELVGLSPKDSRYQKIRATCYTRKYYSDPENLRLQYLRNKKYNEGKRLEKKESFKAIMETVLEEREKSLEEKRIAMNLYNREYYHEIKSDPLFKEKEKEKNKKWVSEHKAYKKINYTLKKQGLLPLTEKEVLRKEEILKKMASYNDFKTFRENNPIDYSWVGAHGFTEMFNVFPDYVKKQQYKSEKVDKLDKEVILLRRAKRNAEKCYELKEYKKRFIASYNYMNEKGIEKEIVALFKTKE